MASTAWCRAQDPPADPHQDDIVNAFDDITYQKGAAVIRMFESWMGEEEFRKVCTRT